ncbi:MAG: NlpC/P60 family protein, partial [Acutalibacteraceae bacterium]|nr:NlpC/P60 family protein [Acutalibacteraceae bacterium]
MIKASDLVAKFRYALENLWGYIWGQWGAMWTAAKQKQKVNYMVSKYGTNWKKSSEAKSDNYYQAALNGDRWIGHNVADCSGLFRWAFDQLGGAISHSSNRIWLSYCNKKGELSKGIREDGTELLPGTAVFVHPSGNSKRTHIGLYTGNGIVIEAASTVKGVIRS